MTIFLNLNYMNKNWILFFILLISGITNLTNAQEAVTTTGGNATSVGGSVSYSVGQIGFTSFDSTTNAGIQQAFDNSISLPITGLTLNAIKKGNEVVVQWETTSETNSSHFIVQRSTTTNSISDSVGKVFAKGNSNILSKYYWIDKLPSKGVNYYKLKQVDKDGKFVYSATVAVNFETGIIVSCYPNPTTSSIKLDIGTNNFKSYFYEIYSLSGKLLQKAMIANTVTTINMEAMQAATYIIKVTNNKNEIVSIVVIKK